MDQRKGALVSHVCQISPQVHRSPNRYDAVLPERQSRASLEGEISTPGSCTCMRRVCVLLRLKRSGRMRTECALVRQQTFAIGVFMIGLSGSTLKRSRCVSFSSRRCGTAALRQFLKPSLFRPMRRWTWS